MPGWPTDTQGRRQLFMFYVVSLRQSSFIDLLYRMLASLSERPDDGLNAPRKSCPAISHVKHTGIESAVSKETTMTRLTVPYQRFQFQRNIQCQRRLF